MARAASSRYSGLTSATARRSLLALACLLAFALQNFVAQTHIHPLLLSAKPAASLSNPLPADGKPPSQDDLNSCPYCQAATLVGVLLGPSALLLFLPTASAHVAPAPAPRVTQADSPAYVWRSRGPPQL